MEILRKQKEYNDKIVLFSSLSIYSIVFGVKNYETLRVGKPNLIGISLTLQLVHMFLFPFSIVRMCHVFQ